MSSLRPVTVASTQVKSQHLSTYRVRELLMRSPSVHPCTLLGTVCGALIVVGIVAAHPAHADFWVRPQVKEVFSQSRESFVRVIPGNSLEDGVGFSGSPRVR